MFLEIKRTIYWSYLHARVIWGNAIIIGLK